MPSTRSDPTGLDVRCMTRPRGRYFARPALPALRDRFAAAASSRTH